jgi:hypothetical protein
MKNDMSKNSGSDPHDSKDAPKRPHETLEDMRALKKEFDTKAADYRRMSETLGAAIGLIEEGRATKAEAEELKHQIAATKAQAAAALRMKGVFETAGTAKAEEFQVFIDGSASMYGTGIVSALLGAGALQTAAKTANAPAVGVAFYGNDALVVPAADLSDYDSVKKFEHGTNCGQNLLPVVAAVEKSVEGSKQRRHILIVSDGDVPDTEANRTAFGRLLGKNENVTVDFLQLSPQPLRPSDMTRLSDSLQKIFPAQVRFSHADPADLNGVLEAVARVQKNYLVPTPLPVPTPVAAATPPKRRPPIPGMGG